jgi:hypothetical protein
LVGLWESFKTKGNARRILVSMFRGIRLCLDLKIIIFRLMGLLDLVFYEQKKFSYFQWTYNQYVIAIYKQGPNTSIVHFVIVITTIKQLVNLNN